MFLLSEKFRERIQSVQNLYSFFVMAIIKFEYFNKCFLIFRNIVKGIFNNGYAAIYSILTV